MSRFRSIAPVVGLILVVTGCNRPPPRRPRRGQSTAASAPAAAGARFGGAGHAGTQTFTGRQRQPADVQRPAGRRAAPAARARLREQLTGGHVNVIAVGFQTIYDKALLDASTGDEQLRRVRLQPAVAGRLRRPGLPADLTDRVNSDTPARVGRHRAVLPGFQRDLQRQGLHDPARRRLPHGLLPERPPRRRTASSRRRPGTSTSTVAEKFQGKDLNGDGEPDYGSCIAKKKGAQSYWWIISVAGGLLQARAPTRARSSTPPNMNPLFGTTRRSPRRSRSTRRRWTFGPPDELNLDVGGTRGLFTTGRCALSMDWGDIGTLTPGHVRRRTRPARSITPGWKEILDRATGKLVPCDATTCPNAVDGVNYAPFASFGGWSGCGQRGRADGARRTPPTPSCRT